MIEDDPDIGEKAGRWMADNPQAMALFKYFAEQMRVRGRRFGIGALTERVRWECALQTVRGDDDYKINNNHRAYIARRLIEEDPRLDGLIELRYARGKT